ncbi:hypothetical protein D6C86_04287 [Aureobasidium pullulans]|nr:hypothetical protein D6C94_04366 [Aureobasidium pullulans]THZ43612.1 hypothetical protein D6C87_04198 [Aureobasidium pullulans]THZ61644.1 hypothetical protein D6C86_04287 [Aureobasidium pullulans]THZ98826.1 hypothetical protein D6C88_00754 [Aureobasidium pullulans]
MGKVHGSLARAGKVKSQTPKVEPQEKKKTPKGRAKKRITYTRRFVNVTMTGGKRKVRTHLTLLLQQPTSADTQADEPQPYLVNEFRSWSLRDGAKTGTWIAHSLATPSIHHWAARPFPSPGNYDDDSKPWRTCMINQLLFRVPGPPTDTIKAGVKDVITLFHSPSSPASIRVHTLLKQTAAAAQTTATQDQASSHPQQSKIERTNFELDVQEGAPTSDQLTNIFEYLGQDKIGSVIEGASSPTEALRKLKESGSAFQRPLVVDWANGRAVTGDNESEILKLLNSPPKA